MGPSNLPTWKKALYNSWAVLFCFSVWRCSVYSHTQSVLKASEIILRLWEEENSNFRTLEIVEIVEKFVILFFFCLKFHLKKFSRIKILSSIKSFYQIAPTLDILSPPIVFILTLVKCYRVFLFSMTRFYLQLHIFIWLLTL